MADHAILVFLALSFVLPALAVFVLLPGIEMLKRQKKERIRREKIRCQMIGERLRSQ